MGVIDSLSAGYRFLARHLYLLIIPALLDLFFLFGPRLGIDSLTAQAAELYRQLGNSAELPADMSGMVNEAADFIGSVGQGSNLFFGLANGMLLRVPSLMAVAGSPPENPVIQSTSTGAVALAAIGLYLLGLWIGVFFMSLLARALPIGAGARQGDWLAFFIATVRHWLRVIGLVAVGIAALLTLFIPVSIMMSLFLLIAPGLFSGMTGLAIGVMTLLSLYLYFVTAGIIMDDLPLFRAIVQSFRLVRRKFWRVVGFAVLSGLISLGIDLALLGFLDFQPPLGALFAILIDAFIGVGLALALLVFYRSQLLAEQGQPVEL
jgi:hypothetical protein